jgi:hypothetical protein
MSDGIKNIPGAEKFQLAARHLALQDIFRSVVLRFLWRRENNRKKQTTKLRLRQKNAS